MSEQSRGLGAAGDGVLSLYLPTLVCLFLGLYAGVQHIIVPTPSYIHPIKRPLPKPKPFSFPGGGRELAGRYRFVALYGSPDMPGLGALGEQPVAAAAA